MFNSFLFINNHTQRSNANFNMLFYIISGHQIIAFIREDNIASIKMNTACGAVMTNDFEMAYIPQLQKEVKVVKFVKEIS